MPTIHPTTKAVLVTAVFVAVALWALVYRAPSHPALAPQLLFYAVLVVNTFLSVRFYSKIQPENISQAIVDFVLVVTYLALALSLGRPVEFALAAFVLFAVAPVKYLLMRGLIPYDALLRRKILIDISGTVFCAAVFAGTVAGYPLESAWVLGVGFALANVYHLIIHPMYRL